jgi:RNA polymerase sigma-70 factor (ECF subfamily)
VVRIRRESSGATLDQIEAIYRHRLDQFLSVASAISRDREAARDIVQDAFATAVRRRSSFRGEGSLEGWLWAIVLNTARTHHRGRDLDQLIDAEEGVLATTNGHVPDEADDIRRAIHSLPDRQRIALFLRYYADLDYAAIAQALGSRPGTIAATLNAAHATLRGRLEGVRS